MLHLEDLYLNGPVNRIPAGMTEEECEEYLQTKEGARFSERELFVEWIATPQGRRYPTTLLRLSSELGIAREQFVIWCAEASFPRELFWKILLKGWCSNLASIPEVFEKRVRANDLDVIHLITVFGGIDDDKSTDDHLRDLERCGRSKWWRHIAHLPMNSWADEITQLSTQAMEGQPASMRLYWDLLVSWTCLLKRSIE